MLLSSCGLWRPKRHMFPVNGSSWGQSVFTREANGLFGSGPRPPQKWVLVWLLGPHQGLYECIHSWIKGPDQRGKWTLVCWKQTKCARCEYPLINENHHPNVCITPLQLCILDLLGRRRNKSDANIYKKKEKKRRNWPENFRLKHHFINKRESSQIPKKNTTNAFSLFCADNKQIRLRVELMFSTVSYQNPDEYVYGGRQVGILSNA